MPKLYRINGEVVNDISLVGVDENGIDNYVQKSKYGVTSAPIILSESGIGSIPKSRFYTIPHSGFIQIKLNISTIASFAGEIVLVILDESGQGVEGVRFYNEGTAVQGGSQASEIYAEVKKGWQINWAVVEAGLSGEYEFYYRLHPAKVEVDDGDKTSNAQLGGYNINNVNIKEFNNEGVDRIRRTDDEYMIQTNIDGGFARDTIRYDFDSKPMIVSGLCELNVAGTISSASISPFVYVIRHKDKNGKTKRSWTITQEQFKIVSGVVQSFNMVVGAKVEVGDYFNMQGGPGPMLLIAFNHFVNTVYKEI